MSLSSTSNVQLSEISYGDVWKNHLNNHEEKSETAPPILRQSEGPTPLEKVTQNVSLIDIQKLKSGTPTGFLSTAWKMILSGKIAETFKFVFSYHVMSKISKDIQSLKNDDQWLDHVIILLTAQEEYKIEFILSQNGLSGIAEVIKLLEACQTSTNEDTSSLIERIKKADTNSITDENLKTQIQRKLDKQLERLLPKQPKDLIDVA